MWLAILSSGGTTSHGDQYMKSFGFALVAVLGIGAFMASATPAQAGVGVVVTPGGGAVRVGPIGIQWGPNGYYYPNYYQYPRYYPTYPRYYPQPQYHPPYPHYDYHRYPYPHVHPHYPHHHHR